MRDTLFKGNSEFLTNFLREGVFAKSKMSEFELNRIVIEIVEHN